MDLFLKVLCGGKKNCICVGHLSIFLYRVHEFIVDLNLHQNIDCLYLDLFKRKAVIEM